MTEDILESKDGYGEGYRRYRPSYRDFFEGC